MLRLSRKLRCTAFLAATILGCTAIAHSASASPVDWGKTFLLQTTGGTVNPGVLVGFNPQPEPPAFGTLFSINDGVAELTITGVSNPVGGPPQGFQFLFGAAAPGGKTGVVYPPDPINDFRIAFGIDFASGQSAFTAIVDVQSSSGGGIAPGSDVMFNPQPEPPATGFGNFDTYGLDFAMASLSDVTLTLRILDAAGNQLDLVAVPEPASAVMFGLALSGFGLVAWRRRIAA